MRLSRLLCSVLFLAIVFGAGSVFAGADKVGVINLQKVLAESKAGKAAAKRLEAKAATFKDKFRAEENELKALQAEIKKKGSVWSEDKRATKMRELQKAGRDFKEKTSDASFEMKQLQEKEISPILKELREIVKKYGEANGYAVIFDKMSGVAYVNDSVDVTSAIVKELDKKMGDK
ncbi:MAG: hypothetical protein CSB28_00420 [Desulfobacterales bacterium]|nr:MAG: hypothetical protein CSB28_00420 [Desulfobacterales bacterium]